MVDKNKKRTGCLRKVLLAFSTFIGLFLLIYAGMWFFSLIGRQSMVVGSLERKYRVHLPVNYDETQPNPLVIALHMYSGTARTMEWISQLNPVADEKGFIVVYPEGYKMSWAEGSNEFAADQENIDDVAFISTLIDRVASDYPVDPNQVYVVGFSSGGLMAHRLGCELSNKVHGIATVGATLTNNILEQCQIEAPVSVLMINGTADQGVPYQGNLLYSSVDETTKLWSTLNQCQGNTAISLPDQFDDGTSIIKTAYSQCDNSDVLLYTIEGGGHTWPGGSDAAQLWGLNGKISSEISASEIMLDFFDEISDR